MSPLKPFIQYLKYILKIDNFSHHHDHNLLELTIISLNNLLINLFTLLKNCSKPFIKLSKNIFKKENPSIHRKYVLLDLAIIWIILFVFFAVSVSNLYNTKNKFINATEITHTCKSFF